MKIWAVSIVGIPYGGKARIVYLDATVGDQWDSLPSSLGTG